MAASYDTVENRPNDKERQEAYIMGAGGYGGEDTKQQELRQKTLPKAES